MSRVLLALVVVILCVSQVWGETMESSLDQGDSAYLDVGADEDADLDMDMAEADEDFEDPSFLESESPARFIPTPAAPGTPTDPQMRLYRQLARTNENMYDVIAKSYNRPPKDNKYRKRVRKMKERYNYYYLKKYNRLMQDKTVDFDRVRKMIATKNPDIDCVNCKVDSIDDQEIPEVIRMEERHDGKLVKVLTGDDAVIDLAGRPKDRVKNLRKVLQKSLKTGSLKLDDMAAIAFNKYLTGNDVLARHKKKKAHHRRHRHRRHRHHRRHHKRHYVNRHLVKPFGGQFKHIKGSFNLKHVKQIYDQMNADATNDQDNADERIKDVVATQGMDERLDREPVYAHKNGPPNSLTAAAGEAPTFFY